VDPTSSVSSGDGTFGGEIEVGKQLFTTKIISVVENISLPRLIRPLAVAPDALDTLGGCAAVPTR
jgi:hypothetical protein